MSDGDVTFFACDRGAAKKDIVKIQLEIPKRVVEAYKARALENKKYSAKEIMENVLTNLVDGVNAG